MNSKGKSLVAVTVLCLALVLATSCEDSGVNAPSDAELTLSVNPGTVVIDVLNSETSAESEVTARLIDGNGFQLSGVNVEFTTSGGTLSIVSGVPDAGLGPVETDPNGRARVYLTLTTDDPEEVEVTATSGSLSDEETVSRTTTANDQPTAVIEVDPPAGALVDQLITFDGTTSDDPDGDDITCFEWTITEALPGPDRTEVVTGAEEGVISRSYGMEVGLSVQLRVSDRVADPCSVFSPNADVISYTVGCDPTPPVAQAGPEQPVALTGSSVTVTLDGRQSFDNESGLREWNLDDNGNPADDSLGYIWTCAGTTALPTGDAGVFTCTYDATGEFEATLTVHNTCGAQASDTTTIRVVGSCGDLTPPVANAGPPQPVTLPPGGGDVTVTLDGRGSSDPESGIADYVWVCGGSIGPATPTADPAIWTCDYGTAGTYQAELTVTNGCDQTNSDSVTITVSNSTP